VHGGRVDRMDKIERTKFGSLEHYYSNFYHLMIGHKSKGLSKFLSAYPHKLMESKFKSNRGFKILEVGVGDFEHLPYVVPNYVRYTGVDTRQPKNFNEVAAHNLNFLKSDVHKLPYQNEEFDRVIATCLIIHLTQPEEAIEEWLRVLKPGGKITMYVALEPSIILQLFRKIYMRRKALKMGFEGYDLFIARDHITYGLRIINIIKSKYPNIHTLRFRPIPLSAWFINAFCVAEIDK
jgi:phosphatidylethanolamine/phosphatidyl-N-methylethanolamine N-methyltransferase